MAFQAVVCQVGGIPVAAFLEGAFSVEACLVGEPLGEEHQAGTPMVGVVVSRVQEEGAFQDRVEAASLDASLEEEHLVEGAFLAAIPEGAPLAGAFLGDTLQANKVREVQDKLH